MSNTGQRKKSFVDARVQGALLRQLIWHWALTCVLVVGYLFLLESFQTGFRGTLADRSAAVWNRYSPLLLVAVTLFPVFVYDALRLSHRFAGPMVNLKKSLSQLARGEAVPPLRFRDNDFWQEITNDFNSVAERLNMNGSSQART